MSKPAVQSWIVPGQPLRLREPSRLVDEPDPKVLAWYGLLVPDDNALAPLYLRFVDGRPVSA